MGNWRIFITLLLTCPFNHWCHPGWFSSLLLEIVSVGMLMAQMLLFTYPPIPQCCLGLGAVQTFAGDLDIKSSIVH